MGADGVCGFAALSPLRYERDDVGGRMETNLTLLLTAVAYKYVVSEWLPKTPYLTVLDIFIILSLLVLVLNTVVSACADLFGEYALWADLACAAVVGVYSIATLLLFSMSLLCPRSCRPKWSSSRPGAELWE